MTLDTSVAKTTDLQALGREDLLGKRPQKTVIGPLEHLLTNYTKVPIRYVSKEESASDFRKAPQQLMEHFSKP